MAEGSLSAGGAPSAAGAVLFHNRKLWAAGLNNPCAAPHIRGLLDPARERPDIWRRVSTPAWPDQAGRVVMGCDTKLERA